MNQTKFTVKKTFVKLMVAHPIKKFPKFYVILRYISMLTSAGKYRPYLDLKTEICHCPQSDIMKFYV